MKKSLARLHRSLNIDKNAQPLTEREIGGHCEGGEGMMRDSKHLVCISPGEHLIVCASISRKFFSA